MLVNGGSASASEITSGALKNLDRAVIIGTRTFGKGSVQELYDNDDHSKLKLTIAQYLTPGDRSIQNLGIVPDIQLQRMYIPEKNDAAGDIVRMLPPTHSYGEKDLDAHLVSTYAKEGDKPTYQVPYMFERKKTPGAKDQKAAPPPDDEDVPDDDEIVEDFEMRFAKQIVSGVTASTRPKLVAGAKKIVDKVRAEEEGKLVTALKAINVDWTAASNDKGSANLEVALTTSGSTIKAGQDLTVTATVKNTGTAAAYRVLPRIEAEDGVFEDYELPIGKVAPGEIKSFTAHLKMPQDAVDRVDRLGLEVREAHNATSKVTPAELHVESLPRPVFAYAWQLVDDGNGDGLVQRGEKYHLQVSVKNTGMGASTADAQVLLRNATGDGVDLDKSRFDIGVLDPGKIKQFDFPLATNATLKADEMVLELMAYDANLDTQSSDKLHFKVMPSVTAQPARGDVMVKTASTIRAGAADDSSVVGTALRGASYPALATFGPWTKIKLDAAGTKVGFIANQAVTGGGAGTSPFTATYNTTPPLINLTSKSLQTRNDTFKLQGTVSDDLHVEDVYIFVSNPTAKVESKKVFYHSNRGSKTPHTLDFSSDLPLWPGSNMVTVVARENNDVRSVKTVYIYKDAPRTAQTP
ncbi:MAG: S41 family peptidase [Kofleriaceae bacterium]